MLFAFDVDGVLCDINNATLGLINEYGYKKDIETMRKLEGYYYSNRTPQIMMGNFLADDDEYVVITARPDYLRDITERWLDKHYPDYTDLYMVGNGGWFARGTDYKEWGQSCRDEKISIMKELGVYVYFEDNPSYVDVYRKAGITTIQYGGRVFR